MIKIDGLGLLFLAKTIPELLQIKNIKKFEKNLRAGNSGKSANNCTGSSFSKGGSLVPFHIAAGAPPNQLKKNRGDSRDCNSTAGRPDPSN